MYYPQFCGISGFQILLMVSVLVQMASALCNLPFNVWLASWDSSALGAICIDTRYLLHAWKGKCEQVRAYANTLLSPHATTKAAKKRITLFICSQQLNYESLPYKD